MGPEHLKALREAGDHEACEKLADEVSLLQAKLHDALEERPGNLVFQKQAWMVIGAFRYSLGRMTSAVGDCVDFLVENWSSLPPGTTNLVARELEREFAEDDEQREINPGSDTYRRWPLGMDCDRKQWERVRKLYR